MNSTELVKLSRGFAFDFTHRCPMAHRIFDDLAQEAAIGVVRGLRKFNARKGKQFPYLRMWAWALMRRYTTRQLGVVKYVKAAIDPFEYNHETDDRGVDGGQEAYVQIQEEFRKCAYGSSRFRW